MRIPVLVTAICLALVVSSPCIGQSLHKVIPLPDTFFNDGGANMVTYNPVNNQFYFASDGDSMVLAIDGTTFAKVALLHLDFDVTAVGCNPKTGKVYIGTFKDSVAVIDGHTNRILTYVGCGGDPCCFGFDTLLNKVYCGGDNGITVLDGSTDKELTTIDVGGAGTGAFCCVPGASRIYCCTDCGPAIIDSRRDSVIMPASGSSELGSLGVEWSPKENRVYVGSDETLWVIDVAGDSVRKRLVPDTEGCCAGALVYNPSLDQVYTLDAESGDLMVFDCGRDSLVDRIPMVSQAPSYACGLCADPFVGKVYCVDWDEEGGLVTSCDVRARTLDHVRAGDDPVALAASTRERKLMCADDVNLDVLVLSTASDSLLATVALTDWSTAVAASPRTNKLYVSCFRGGLLALDPLSGALVSRLGTFNTLWSLCFGLGGSRLYASPESDQESLLVFDTKTDSLVGRLSLGPVGQGGLTHLVVDEERARIYCLNDCDSAVAIVDQTNCTVKGHVILAGSPGCACLDSAAGRLYVSNTRWDCILSVIDCYRDSIVANISLPCPAAAMCTNPGRSEVYVSLGDKLMVFDGIKDSVVAAIVAGSGHLGSFCLDPADDRVYCAVGTDKVAAVDCATRKVVATIQVGYQPDNLWYNAASGHIFCTMSEAGSIAAIDPIRESVVAEIPIRAWPCGFSASHTGELVFVNSQCNFITVVGDQLPASPMTAKTGGALFKGTVYLRGGDPTRIVNSAGRCVRTLVPGSNDITGLAAGVYFALPQTQNSKPAKLVVIK
ncbi:MAG TPA: hypothetical protein VMH22_09180 [bacterium]|nr:hypothetical protein [bacterium]